MESHSFNRPLKTPISNQGQAGANGLEEKSKMEMWKELGDRFHLPDYKSPGCTKEYLRLVEADRVYRVDRIKLQTYLVGELPKNRGLKYQWRNDVEYARFDVYLRSIGKKPLGFDTQRGYPNEKWLMEVLRYEDPLNILDVYANVGPQRHDMNYANNQLAKRKDMINDVHKQLFSEKMRNKNKWKTTYADAKSKSKVCYVQQSRIQRLEKELDQAKKDLKTFRSERDTLQNQLLSMVDGEKAIKIEYHVIADNTNNSAERRQMMDFMFG